MRRRRSRSSRRDLDEEAIADGARRAFIPTRSPRMSSEERLRRFFVKEHRGYRVRRELREMVLFAAHDLLKDAPFSRLDLISCRNLLIYLNREAQQRVFDIVPLRAASRAGCFSSASRRRSMKAARSSAWSTRSTASTRSSPRRAIGLPVPVGPSTLLRAIEAQERRQRRAGRAWPAALSQESAVAVLAAARTRRRWIARRWAELHFKLIERFAPPSVIVDRDHDIVHLSESAGRFLQIAGGEPTMNLLRLVHPSLRVELRAALFRAAQTERCRSRSSRADRARRRAAAASTSACRPAQRDRAGLPARRLRRCASRSRQREARRSPRRAGAGRPPSRARARAGQRRTCATRWSSTRRRTEELKASNEELQAMNEELRQRDRGAGDEPRGAAVDQRGADDGEPGAARARWRSSAHANSAICKT